jgi:hypothetical protein
MEVPYLFKAMRKGSLRSNKSVPEMAIEAMEHPRFLIGNSWSVIVFYHL